MDNFEFIVAFFFPLFFCFLFIFSKNIKGNNSKYFGFVGVIGYVFLWSWYFLNGMQSTGMEGLVFQSTQFSIIDFRFNINLGKTFFVLLNVCLAFLNFCWFWKTRTIHEKFYQFIYFILLFFSTGALLSENIFSFLAFGEVGFFAVILLIYSYGPKLQRNDIFNIVAFNFVAFLFIVSPIVFILYKGNLLFSNFSTNPIYIKNVLTSINNENKLLGNLLIFFMTIGAFIKCSFFPFHSWTQISFLKLRKELIFPIFGIILLLSFYYLSFFISPLVQELAPDLMPIFLILFSLGVAFNAVLLFQEKQENIYFYILKLFYIHINFCGLGVFLYLGSNNYLILSHLGINFLTFFTLISLASSKSKILPLKDALTSTQPLGEKAKNLFFLTFIASYSGFPLLGFFNNEIIILYNLISQDIFLGVLLVFFSILPVIKILGKMTYFNVNNESNNVFYFEYFNLKSLAVVFLLLVNFILGFKPSLLISYLN